MVSTKQELKRIVHCACLQIPCIHNPDVSEDIRITVKIEGELTGKGVKYVYLDKKKFLIVEETDSIIKMQVLD